jgi:hypothetical protein
MGAEPAGRSWTVAWVAYPSRVHEALRSMSEGFGRNESVWDWRGWRWAGGTCCIDVDAACFKDVMI